LIYHSYYLSLVHSFIIDLEDPYICTAFTDEELTEISEENRKEAPYLDNELLQFISSFAKVNYQTVYFIIFFISEV
jgi:hypothetical protein